MGREAELFKAAQTGNTSLLEKVFASYLKKATGGGHHGRSVRHVGVAGVSQQGRREGWNR